MPLSRMHMGLPLYTNTDCDTPYCFFLNPAGLASKTKRQPNVNNSKKKKKVGIVASKDSFCWWIKSDFSEMITKMWISLQGPLTRFTHLDISIWDKVDACLCNQAVVIHSSVVLSKFDVF